MGDSPAVLRVGLTGGIATGKTTVVGFLAEMGVFVMDADELSHQVTAPGGSAYQAVIERFGRRILDGDGRINRTVLGAIVFADRRARAELEAIVHPRVRAEADRRIEECVRTGHSPLAVFDAALLVETGAYRDFDRLVVVVCSPETQRHRLIKRDGLHLDEAEARISAQAPMEAKIAVADYVIDTDGTLSQTRERTMKVYAALITDYEERLRG